MNKSASYFPPAFISLHSLRQCSGIQLVLTISSLDLKIYCTNTKSMSHWIQVELHLLKQLLGSGNMNLCFQTRPCVVNDTLTFSVALQTLRARPGQALVLWGVTAELQIMIIRTQTNSSTLQLYIQRAKQEISSQAQLAISEWKEGNWWWGEERQTESSKVISEWRD